MLSFRKMEANMGEIFINLEDRALRIYKTEYVKS